MKKFKIFFSYGVVLIESLCNEINKRIDYKKLINKQIQIQITKM